MMIDDDDEDDEDEDDDDEDDDEDGNLNMMVMMKNLTAITTLHLKSDAKEDKKKSMMSVPPPGTQSCKTLRPTYSWQKIGMTATTPPT
jgi:hypothetical protein